MKRSNNDVKFYYGTDGINVNLINFTENPLELIARITFATKTNRLEDIRGKRATNLAMKVLEGKELPVGLEAINYVFTIENVSRNCTHQLVRTRVGAGFSQQSQRAVILEKPLTFRIPEFKEEFNKLLLRDVGKEAVRDYMYLIDDLVEAEDARFILPSAICTHIIAIYNLASLRNVLRFRRCFGAQWEIRNVANKMLEEVKRVHPLIAKYLDLSCKKAKRCFHPQKDNPIIQKCPIMKSFKKENK